MPTETLTELTGPRVRDELIVLCEKYPDRIGRDDKGRCRYRFDGKSVCLIGVWLDEVHPELHRNTAVERLVDDNNPIINISDYLDNRRNGVAIAVEREAVVDCGDGVLVRLTKGALKVLGFAQDDQDGTSTEGKSWSEVGTALRTRAVER